MFVAGKHFTLYIGKSTAKTAQARTAKGFLVLSIFFFLFIIPFGRVAAREAIDVCEPTHRSGIGVDRE